MTRPTQTPGSTSDAKKRLTLVPTPCCDAAAAVARVEAMAVRWGLMADMLTDASEDSATQARGALLASRVADLRAALDGPAGGGGRA